MTLAGSYALFRELGYTTNFIDSRKIASSLKGIKILYIPEAFILSDEVFECIKDFEAKGGYVIAEEGIGLRQDNTWLSPTWPRKAMADFFGCVIEERVSTTRGAKDSLELYGKTIPPVEFISYLRNNSAETEGAWREGRCGVVRKGNAFYLGTSLGASFHDNFTERYCDITAALERLLAECGISSEGRLPRGVYRRSLQFGEKSLDFFFNRTKEDQTISINGKPFSLNSGKINMVFCRTAP